MILYKSNRNIIFRLLILISFIFSPAIMRGQQKIGFGIHVDPAVSWFSSDIKETKYDGARPGLNFGLTFNSYFSSNYSFSTGISIISCGGTLVNSDTTILEFTDLNSKVLPGQPVTYRIQYLSVPIGLKLQTNQIGYITIFSDLGIDPKVVIRGKADIPSLGIKGEKASSELNDFNLSYHITAGIEYSLGGTTAMVLGLSFENNFLDITKENGKQKSDKISNKLLSLRIGLNF